MSTMTSKLKEAASVVLTIGFGIGSIALLILFFKFGATAALKVAPFLNGLSGVVFFLDLLVFLPMLIFRKSRNAGIVAIFISSYVFGTALWVQGFLVSLYYWGWLAVIIGLFLAGIGVVPIGIAASLFNQDWTTAVSLVINLTLVFGTRYFAIWLDDRQTKKKIIDADLFEFEDFEDVPREGQGSSSGKSIWKNLPFVRRRYRKGKSRPSYLGEIIFLIVLLLSSFLWLSGVSANVVLLGLWIFIFSILFSLVQINYRTMLLPDKVLLKLGAVVVVYQLVSALYLGSASILLHSVIGGFLLGGFLYMLAAISRGRWVGGGDIKLGFIAGLLLGWAGGILCLVIAAILFGLMAFGARQAGGEKSNKNASSMPSGAVWAMSIVTVTLLIQTAYLVN